MRVNGCLNEAKCISSRRTETAQTHLLFLPETLQGSNTNTYRRSRVRFYACVGQPLLKQLCVVLPCSQDNNLSMERFAF